MSTSTIDLDVKGLKDLLNKAKVVTEENDKRPPVFSAVPQKFRDFVGRANELILDVKAQISIDKLHSRNTRQTTKGMEYNMDVNEKEKNIKTIKTFNLFFHPVEFQPIFLLL